MKTIKITDGKMSQEIKVSDSAVVEVVEEKNWKNGDVLYSPTFGNYALFEKIIFENHFSCHWVSCEYTKNQWNCNYFIPATTKQAAEAYSLMQKDGLQWNAEEGCVEKYRWKPEGGEWHDYVGYNGNRYSRVWVNGNTDIYLYSIGNVHKPNDTESITKYKQYLLNYAK